MFILDRINGTLFLVAGHSEEVNLAWALSTLILAAGLHIIKFAPILFLTSQGSACGNPGGRQLTVWTVPGRGSSRTGRVGADGCP